jgi:hypothetical protein
MESRIMTLNHAKTIVDFPELSLVLLWQSWLSFTDIEIDALEHLTKCSSRILLPNVKAASTQKMDLLKTYKGYLQIGFDIH